MRDSHEPSNDQNHGHSHSHTHGSHSHAHSHSRAVVQRRSPGPQVDRPTENDMEKVRSTIKQFVRDWSAEVRSLGLVLSSGRRLA